MKIIAYSYSDPLLESIPDPGMWGWEVDKIYTDLGERTQLKQLFKDCKKETAEYLLIRRLEELGDTVQNVCEVLAKLEQLGLKIVAIESQFIIQEEINRVDLLKFISEIQQNQRSRQIRQGHARNRVKALPPPGKAPYGYRRSKDRYGLDRSAAPVVKDFFEHFLLYGSLRGAVRYLEQKYGKKISVATGRNWLINPVYRGDLAFKNGEVICNTHLAIISREEAAQVERILRRNRSLPPRSASAPRSLSGLVVCENCGSVMTVVRVTAYRKQREYLYLRPTNCSKQPKCKSMLYEEILNQIIEVICQELPRAVGGLKMPRREGVKERLCAEIEAKEQILAQLPALRESGILDQETEQLRIYKLRTEIADLQSQVSQQPPGNLREIAKAVSLKQFWLDLSESERRFYFREFISKVEIMRENDNWKLRVIFIF
ncbi:MAG TPA: recombinase family protein [Halomicronema sp.]